MKPFTIYNLYKDIFSSFHQPLIDLIVKAAKPEMICLLSASLHRIESESIFNESAPSSRYISDCFLLILLQGLDNKELHEWQDKIETNCKTLAQVTTIVLEANTFKEWLKNGHRFALNVQQSGAVLYNSENFSLTMPQEFTNTITIADCKKQYYEGLMKAKEFLAGSELFRIRRQYAMAAFMLHQSAEQALRTLLKAGTGYHANIHSLDRLIRYASLISHQLADIFPQRTDREKQLFNLLQRAYIDSRYKEDYKISNDDLVCLTEKVKNVHRILASKVENKSV